MTLELPPSLGGAELGHNGESFPPVELVSKEPSLVMFIYPGSVIYIYM